MIAIVIKGIFYRGKANFEIINDRVFKGDEMINANAQLLLEKIQSLSAERIAQVDDFVDFLRLKEQERSLTRLSAEISAPVFTAIWDNPDDEAYNAL
ncbi:hypothetical protein AAKU67_000491 [Oxalobacteraceae bacterium GrIS 2.11]